VDQTGKSTSSTGVLFFFRITQLSFPLVVSAERGNYEKVTEAITEEGEPG
jgi:hypothetical protein